MIDEETTLIVTNLFIKNGKNKENSMIGGSGEEFTVMDVAGEVRSVGEECCDETTCTYS